MSTTNPYDLRRRAIAYSQPQALPLRRPMPPRELYEKDGSYLFFGLIAVGIVLVLRGCIKLARALIG